MSEATTAAVPAGNAETQVNRISADVYDKMEGGARLDYARGHDQATLPEWRDPRTAPAEQPASDTATAARRPAWCPEAAWDVNTGIKFDDFGKYYAESVAPILARDEAEQTRRASIPAKADDYKIGTSPSFKAPEGDEFKIDESAPQWAQLRSWAHKHGVSQDALHQAIDLYASSEMIGTAKFRAARDAEFAKLGAGAGMRVTAIETLMDAAGVGELKSRIWNSRDVPAWESLFARLNIRPAKSSETAPRDGVDADAWSKMSPGERMHHARSVDQSKLPAWRDPRAE